MGEGGPSGLDGPLMHVQEAYVGSSLCIWIRPLPGHTRLPMMHLQGCRRRARGRSAAAQRVRFKVLPNRLPPACQQVGMGARVK